MPDFEQDIIRRVRIETQVDSETIKKSSTVLDNFYKKYQNKDMKVDTSDFFQAIDAIRTLRKELDTTQKNSPHMEGIIGQMSVELEKASQQFGRTMVRFANGDMSTGLNEAVDKISSGLSIQAVDLGDFLSAVNQRIRDTVDALKEIGAIKEDWKGNNYVALSSLSTTQLESAIGLMDKLKESQAELEVFEVKTLSSKDLYSGTPTNSLSRYLDSAKRDLNELKLLNLETMSELYDRRSIISNIQSESDGLYGYWEFDEIKEDPSQYEASLKNLREYVSNRNDILESLQVNSHLFTTSEFEEYTTILTNNISEANTQIQELQQLGGKTVDPPIGGDFTELTKILGDIKESLQTISDVFKHESNAMSDMAENGVTSFTSLSQAIIEVYNNLTQVQGLVDAISQKDFNITNVTQVGGGNNSNLQAMKQQMAIARDTMEHLRQLYDQASETLTLLGQGGQVGLVMDYAQQLQELSLTDINKSIKGANTEMKLASVLAEMQDYIDKLTQINELRNKHNLGEWKDTFVPSQKAKPTQTSRPEEIKIITPSVELPKETAASDGAEITQMTNLKGAVDEVSKAIGRKNAGFIKEQEIVDTSVEAEKAKETMAAVADDTVQPSNWDRISQLQKDHGEDPFALSRSKTDNVGDKSVRTIVESWGPVKDEDGKLTGELELNTVKIINDFKKRTDAITKENEKIKTAQAYLQKFLTQFNNKTMGKGSLLSGYQDLADLAISPDFKIDDIAKAEQMMSNLDAEYNKVVQSMRKGSSSMNPFVNAINSMDKMEDVLRGISLQFRTLDQQPDWLKEDVTNLYRQLDDLSAETDIYKFAEGFGDLKVAINSVTESIRQQRVEQKLTLSDFKALVKAIKTRDDNVVKAAKEKEGSDWEGYYLDRATEQQKVVDAIRIGLTLTDEQEAQLNVMAEKHALMLKDITLKNNKLEEQKQKYEKIMRLLEKNRADQIDLDNDTSLNAEDRSAYQQILNDEYAQIEALINSADLNPEQTKSVKKLTQARENDRVAKVKEYIDLLRLQYDYEKKAAKEDDGSKMQSFYKEQITKVEAKLKKFDIESLVNQDEKNKLLALEEEKKRAIAEIEAKRSNAPQKKQAGDKEKQLFIPQDKKIQDRYDAGYLSKEQYNNWQIALVEYQNYMAGVAQADEKTVANKKQSLMQLYDAMIKASNASKSFFASGGEILPEDMWFDKNQIADVSKSLNNLYQNIATERFEGMKTSVTRLQPELGKLFFTVDDGNGSLAQYAIQVNKATGATKLLESSTKPALTTLQRFGQTLKKDFTGLLTAVMGGTSIHTFVQYMRQGINYVRELDLALTELKKVTDETEETYDRFLDTASTTSARIGKTITEMTSATAEFAKLGYNIEQAASMAESALVYANVGDNVDVETGSQSIISTLKAFGIEANNTMSIVDKFNEVGNNFAITTKGIGDALQVSASAMAAAGNSLDETIALMTAANTIVQNPNTVGKMLCRH